MPNTLENIQKPDQPLIDELVAHGKKELLRILFDARTARWQHAFISGEFGTLSLFHDLCCRLGRVRAFELIPTATSIALDQHDLDRFTTSLGLLLDLSRCSDTTEMPSELSKRWPALAEKVRCLTEHRVKSLFWSELVRFYRQTSKTNDI